MGHKVSCLACLQVVCGCFYRGKTPENAEFAIAGAILNVCESRSDQFLRASKMATVIANSSAFSGSSAINTPTNGLQTGYELFCYQSLDKPVLNCCSWLIFWPSSRYTDTEVRLMCIQTLDATQS